MAEAESDLDWMAKMTRGIRSGLMSGGWSMAKWSLTWGLNATFGLHLGKGAKQQQLREALTAITREIGVIEENLQVIESQLADLSDQVKASTIATITATREQALDTAANVIDTHWREFTRLVTAARGAEGGAHDPTIAFAKNVRGTWDIAAQANAVCRALLPQRTGGDEGLLNLWTDGIIVDLDAGRYGLDQGYAILEQNFLQTLHVLFRGHSLELNALVRLQVGTDPDPVLDDDGMRKAAESYTARTVAPMLKDLCRQFRECAHRMVLSRYQRPDPKGKLFLPFPDASRLDPLLSRVYLIDWLVRRAEDDAEPGILASAYVRPSQVSGSGGPALRPGAGCDASRGEPLDVEYGGWYRVVDFVDPECRELRPWGESAIAVVEYRWKWPSPPPPAGTRLGGEGVFGSVTARYYDPATLAPVDPEQKPATGGPEPVLYAYATDASGITDPVMWSLGASWQVSSTDDRKYHSVRWNPSDGVMSRSPLKRWVLSELTVDGDYGKDDRDWTVELTRTIRYDGEPIQHEGRSPGLYLVIDADYTLLREEDIPHPGSGQSRRYATAAEAEVKIWFPDRHNKLVEDHRKDAGEDANRPFQYRTLVDLKPGTTELVFHTHLTTRKHKLGFRYDGDSTAHLRSRWNVALATFAWQQPEVQVST